MLLHVLGTVNVNGTGRLPDQLRYWQGKARHRYLGAYHELDDHWHVKDESGRWPHYDRQPH